MQLSIQKEEAKKKEIHVEDNVPAPSPRSNCSVELELFPGALCCKSLRDS